MFAVADLRGEILSRVTLCFSVTLVRIDDFMEPLNHCDPESGMLLSAVSDRKATSVGDA